MTDIGPTSIPALEKKLVPLGLIAYFVLALTVSLRSGGTYDAGDSVMHFEVARWAFAHPENFLYHWGKPFFTLLAAPFAQLGFGGMKLLQCLLALGSGWMLWRAAHRLQLQPAWLAPLLAFGAIEYFLAQLSGLTEPLFAFTLLLGVFLCLHERPVMAAMALSLLPFVRTEGFLLLPVFGLYLLTRYAWKALPFLAAGTFVYMLVGGIFKGNFLWIWTENPYSGMAVPYGVGGILHFPEQYLFVAGIPICVLTGIGLLLLPLRWLPKYRGAANLPLLLLVVAPFLTYFGMHTFFWVTGIGHSMGLQRVLIGVVPLGALIALAGLQQVLQFLPHRVLGTGLTALVMAYVVLFPMLPNPAAIHAVDLRPTVDQQMIQSAATWIAAAGLSDRKICSAHPSVPYLSDKDPFDPDQYSALLHLSSGELSTGTIVVHDSWFGPVEAGFALSYFNERPLQYKRLQTWNGAVENTPIVLTLFEKI